MSHKTPEKPNNAAVKLLQGYLWYPRELSIDFADYLPESMASDIYLLWEEMPRPPITFFDDGSLAETQQFFQITMVQLLPDSHTQAVDIEPFAKELQELLNKTPEGVGWQIFEDLRDL